MGVFETANKIAVLLGGLSPDWSTQSDAAVADGGSFPLPVAESGVALGESITAGLAVRLRENAAYRTARLTVTFVASKTYTVTIDGHDVVYDNTGDADAADVLLGIAAAINADSTANALVLAEARSAEDTTTGVKTQVVLTGKDEADYSLACAADASATIAIVADAAECAIDLWAMASGQGPGWARVNGVDEIAVDSRGLYETLDSLGPLSRLYVQCRAVAGATGDGAGVTYKPTVFVGPCRVS